MMFTTKTLDWNKAEKMLVGEVSECRGSAIEKTENKIGEIFVQSHHTGKIVKFFYSSTEYVGEDVGYWDFKATDGSGIILRLFND